MDVDYLEEVTECEPLLGHRLKVTCFDGVSGVMCSSPQLLHVPGAGIDAMFPGTIPRMTAVLHRHGKGATAQRWQ